jgi:hypothetical protein
MTISVKTESNLPNGLVRRRYEVTLTDELGNEHTEVVGMFNHEPSNDGSEVELQLLQSKKLQEAEEYKTQIERGNNPFSGSTSLWNTRPELLKYVLDMALTLPATEAIVYNGLPYLERVSDEELQVLYNKSPAWVALVREKTAELLAAKHIMDSYEAVL